LHRPASLQYHAAPHRAQGDSRTRGRRRPPTPLPPPPPDEEYARAPHVVQSASPSVLGTPVPLAPEADEARDVARALCLACKGTPRGTVSRALRFVEIGSTEKPSRFQTDFARFARVHTACCFIRPARVHEKGFIRWGFIRLGGRGEGTHTRFRPHGGGDGG
jgi:hypothetical protein